MADLEAAILSQEEYQQGHEDPARRNPKRGRLMEPSLDGGGNHADAEAACQGMAATLSMGETGSNQRYSHRHQRNLHGMFAAGPPRCGEPQLQGIHHAESSEETQWCVGSPTFEFGSCGVLIQLVHAI